MRQFVLWPSNRLDLESLRRDISGLLGGSYKTEACFEISAMKQEFIKRNYPDGGGWSARIHVTNEEGFGLIEVSDMRAHMFTMLASRCRAFAGLFVLWMGSFWVTNHWVQTKLQDQMVCKWSRYQTRLCTLQLMSLKAIFRTVSIDKKFLPTAASGLCSIHAAQVIPLLHGTDRCSNLLCDGQKRCCEPWSDEGPGALSHYSTAFSTTVLISQILAYVKESSDAGVGPLAFPSRAKDSWFLGAPDSVVL